MGSAYTDAGKPDEAIAALDKVLAMPNLPDQFKQVAQAEKDARRKSQNRQEVAGLRSVACRLLRAEEFMLADLGLSKRPSGTCFAIGNCSSAR